MAILKIFSRFLAFSRLAALYLLTLGWVSCNDSPYDVDVSEIKAEIKVERFGQDLFSIPADSIANEVPRLANQYGSFFDLFSFEIISPSRGLADPNFSYGLYNFVTDFNMQTVYKDCEKAFPDLDWLETDLTMAFKHYKYYFPKRHLPRVISYMSGFNYSIVTDSLMLAIGLERYLGPDYRYYPQLQYPKYMTFKMKPEYIVPDCMRAWAISEFPSKGKQDFLNAMIYEGKLIYYLHCMLPESPETLLLAFTESELAWCEAHEQELWAHFIDKELLYATDEKTILEYTAEAPFTPGFPEEAPDRSANWIGYRIVKKFMERKKSSLAELMREDNGQMILEISGYKP